jgi:hypothetical protein
VAHYFVFGNQNKRFVCWRAGLDRKQEVNVKMYFIPEMAQLVFGGLNINNK